MVTLKSLGSILGYILALDAGTTSSRALIIDQSSQVVGIQQEPFNQHYPNHGWVEHAATEIWDTQIKVAKQVLETAGISAKEIEAIGITNQRETSVIWDRNTGKPLWNAIVWNDRRTKDRCDSLQEKWQEKIHSKTGLFLESYFSATKIEWLLNKVDPDRRRSKNKELCFGTINTWLLWNLTKGAIFATDITNASRTLLFNIHTLDWDDELLELFNVPREILPEVRSCSEVYGETANNVFDVRIKIAAMIGDQQASLFGHACFSPGELKCTYGTGAFLMMNTGDKPIVSNKGLLTTIAYKIGDEAPQYAFEGLVYAAGAVVNWLMDSLGIIKTAKEIEGLAYSVPDSGGVYFVPTLNGLATPYWNAYAKGTILGITPSTNIGHISRATLEGIAYQIADIIEIMKQESSQMIHRIKCGGGMSENTFLLQIQSNLLNIPIVRAVHKEMTALGAGYLAGLAVKYWTDRSHLGNLWAIERTFEPNLKESDRALMKKSWKTAIRCTELWAEGNLN